MNVASLNAVADWNANRACDLFRQHHYEKNHDRAEGMLRDYARMTKTTDAIRRLIWMHERTRK